MNKERIVYLDYLRILATIAIVVLHISAQNWYNFNGRSLEWNIFNIYDSLTRWGAPIFLMISGSLFLEKEVDIKKLYSKNILKLTTVYFIWSLFYATFLPIILKQKTTSHQIIINTITGHYHMWFIPMMIGIYICIPIIKQLTKNKTITKYFLMLSLIFNFIIPQAVNISNDFIGGPFSYLVNETNKLISNMNINLVLGYVFYFILGHYLKKLELNKKQRKIIYILGIVGFVLTILLNAIIAWKTNKPCGTYYSNFTINVLLETIAIYIYFKYKKIPPVKYINIISKLSKYSLGVYLIHPFVINIIKLLGLNTITINAIISVPLIAMITVTISYLISLILNKITTINKWVV